MFHFNTKWNWNSQFVSELFSESVDFVTPKYTDIWFLEKVQFSATHTHFEEGRVCLLTQHSCLEFKAAQGHSAELNLSLRNYFSSEAVHHMTPVFQNRYFPLTLLLFCVSLCLYSSPAAIHNIICSFWPWKYVLPFFCLFETASLISVQISGGSFCPALPSIPSPSCSIS